MGPQKKQLTILVPSDSAFAKCGFLCASHFEYKGWFNALQHQDFFNEEVFAFAVDFENQWYGFTYANAQAQFEFGKPSNAAAATLLVRTAPQKSAYRPTDEVRK